MFLHAHLPSPSCINGHCPTQVESVARRCCPSQLRGRLKRGRSSVQTVVDQSTRNFPLPPPVSSLMNRLAHQKRQADVAAQAERLAASARGEEVYWDSDDVESATSSQLSGQDFFEQIDEDVGGLSQEDEDVASDVNAGAPFDTSRRSPNENELEAQDIASPSGVQRNVARAPSSCVSHTSAWAA